MGTLTQSTSVLPEQRRSSLRSLLASGKTLRFMEVHDPLSALIAEKIFYEGRENNIHVSYDGFWSSSLADSTIKGKPDIEVLSIPYRLHAINDIFEVTTKPLIMDGDTGGKTEHLVWYIRELEQSGISALIIEDKKGLKKNSLFGNDVYQQQEEAEVFAEKIHTAKKAQLSQDFMIFARIESLILEKGIDDALERAEIYLSSGADGIMIHSRKETPQEVFEFSLQFRKKHKTVPLVCVPTSYHNVTVDTLAQNGFNIVIYANHLIRAAYPAMENIARRILIDGCAGNADKQCMPIKEILNFIPGTK